MTDATPPLEGPAKPPDPAATGDVAVCSCGHDVDHLAVAQETDYSFTAWCMLLFGVSVMPRALLHRCQLCREVVQKITDPQALAEHM